MNPYLAAVVLVLGILAGHVYTIDQAQDGEYHWCKGE